jgi:hypothetical protein
MQEEELLGGFEPDVFLAKWEQFLKPTDLVLFWGSYGVSLFQAMGASCFIRYELQFSSQEHRRIRQDIRNYRADTDDKYFCHIRRLIR